LSIEKCTTDINSKTKEAVVALVKELDYEPNALARSLVQRRTNIIGLFHRVSKSINSSKVLADNVEGAYTATKHLIEQGYKRIAHISGPLNLDIIK